MQLEKFIEMYRSNNNALFAYEMEVNRSTMGRWVESGDYSVIHRSGKFIKLVQTKTIRTCEGYHADR